MVTESVIRRIAPIAEDNHIACWTAIDLVIVAAGVVTSLSDDWAYLRLDLYLRLRHGLRLRPDLRLCLVRVAVRVVGHDLGALAAVRSPVHANHLPPIFSGPHPIASWCWYLCVATGSSAWGTSVATCGGIELPSCGRGTASPDAGASLWADGSITRHSALPPRRTRASLKT
ncbi:hypothetical protein KC335_g33 [Hortaea werneckii]|nr:hypothetical protein KC335_g33 [Hortaea werneckii]